MDAQSKLVADCTMSVASAHVSQPMPDLIMPEDARQEVYADRAYAGKPIADDIQKKGAINLPP